MEKWQKNLVKAGKAADSSSKTTDVYFNSEVEEIEKVGKKFKLTTVNGTVLYSWFRCRHAGAHSLFLQIKPMENIWVLSMAGSFYITNGTYLNGKVYMVQNDKLPFAALHGLPRYLMCDGIDWTNSISIISSWKIQRWKIILPMFKNYELWWKYLKIFCSLLKDSDIRNYIFKNFLFEVPGIYKGLIC